MKNNRCAFNLSKKILHLIGYWYGRTGNKNVQLVLQHCCSDELKSDVACFVIHIQTCLARNKVGCKLRESVLTSHSMTLPRSHTHGSCVTCCKTSFPYWAS